MQRKIQGAKNFLECKIKNKHIRQELEIHKFVN